MASTLLFLIQTWGSGGTEEEGDREGKRGTGSDERKEGVMRGRRDGGEGGVEERGGGGLG